MQSNEEISIRYVLADSTQSLPTDEIGSMEIYVSGELVEGNEGIRVIEGRRVEVVLALNRGYTYYGYKQNSGAINRDGIEGNRLVISESFDVERDSVEYIIYVSKESIEAILDQSERNSKNYTIEGGEKTVSSESTTLSGLYVGKVITFNRI